MVEENGIRRTGCTPREDLRPPLLDEETRSAGERWLLGALKSLVTDLGGLVEAFADDDRLYRVWRGSAKAFVLLQEPTEQTVELFCSTDPTGTLVGAIAAERSGRSARQPDGPVEEFARIVVTVDRHRQALEPPRQ